MTRQIRILLFVGLPFVQSVFGQALIERTFFNEGFESLEATEITGIISTGSGTLSIEFDEEPEVGEYQFEARVSDGIGNPNKAIEVNANFSWTDEDEDAPWGSLGVDHSGGTIGDIDDPQTEIQWDFDLYTTQTSPVEIRTLMGTSTGFGEIWDGHSGMVTNDSPNSWKSHSVTFYAFGLRNEDRISRALLYESIGVDLMTWEITTDDWGHESENIFRLDNVRMKIIPETSEYIFASGICLVAFAMFRRIRISQTS